MNSKALHTLEFDKILEMLAEIAPTEGSAEMARALTPSSDIVKVRLLAPENGVCRGEIVK